MCALNIVLASLYAAPPILCRILWTLSAFFSASSAPHWSHFEEQYWQCLLRKSCWLSSTPLPDPFNIVLRTIEASAVQITMHCVFSATMSTVQECKLCWEIILWGGCLSAADPSFPGKANSSVWKWEPAQGIHASSLQRSGCSAAPPCIHNHCTRHLTWRYVLPIIAATMEYGCTGDCAFEIVPAINYWCNMTLMLAPKLHKLFQSNLFWGIAISSVRFDQAR